MTQIWALRSRLEKQATDRRRRHHNLRDGALVFYDEPGATHRWILWLPDHQAPHHLHQSPAHHPIPQRLPRINQLAFLVPLLTSHDWLPTKWISSSVALSSYWLK